MRLLIKKYVSAVLFISLFSLFLTGCAVFKKAPIKLKDTALVRMTPSEYPDFGDDLGYDGLAYSIRQSLSYLKNIPENKRFRFGQETFDAIHMITSLEHFLDFITTEPTGHQLKKYIHSKYIVYSSVGRDNSGQVLFTGYYEPFLEGRLERRQSVSISDIFPTRRYDNNRSILIFSTV